MEDKYIDLLLNRCINFDKTNSLFISGDKVNMNFINKVVEKVKDMGISDIYLDITDVNVTLDKLNNSSLEEIVNDPYFDKSIWDKYAEKDEMYS